MRYGNVAVALTVGLYSGMLWGMVCSGTPSGNRSDDFVGYSVGSEMIGEIGRKQCAS